MALTHDGALLIVPDGSYVYLLDTDRLIHGADPVVGMISDGDLAGAINAVTTSEDRLLLVSDESLHQVTVIDLAKARQSVFRQLALIGRIPTGRDPVGFALSSHDEYLTTDDGKALLVTDFDSDQIELLSVDQLPQKDANLDAVNH